MKTLRLSVMLGLLSSMTFAASTVHAAVVTTSPSFVGLIRLHDGSAYTTGSDHDWFNLQGVTSLGACPVYAGFVLFKLSDSDHGRRQLAILQAAQLAGKKVTVTADTTQMSDGFCRAFYIDAN